MKSPAPVLSPSHPWIGQLHAGMDTLAAALLRGDAGATEQASAALQDILLRAPPPAELADGGRAMRTDLVQAAQRFTQLRQAALRNASQSQRAVHSLLPQTKAATYARQGGPVPSSTGGAGRGYLTA